MNPFRWLLVLWAGLALVARAGAEPAAVTLTRLADRVRIEIGGRLFTEYVFGDGAPRPYCHPVLAPDGTPLTRDFPMKETPGEEHDHVHHRSLWFAHGAVNGVDFWTEGKKMGKIVHESLLETSGGDTGVVRARHRWLAPDGRLVCTDETTLRIRPAGTGILLDYEVTLRANPGEPLLLGDSKEGTMALRVAQWMTPPHKYQGQSVPGAGHILTSTGERDTAAWGQRAAWCAYYAPRAGKVYGVAIFDHPQNLRHPTWWMVRDYGLFAANPFGRHEFEKLPDQPHLGDHTVPAGGSLTLCYRFYFHVGDPAAAKVAEQYRDYAATRGPAPAAN